MPINKKQVMRMIKLVAELRLHKYPNATSFAARLARERLHPDRAAIVLVGPAEAIVPQLEGLGPVEVVQP